MVGVVRAERDVRRRLPERRPPREVSSTKTIDPSEMWFAVRTRDDWCLEDGGVVDRTEQLGAMPLSTHTLRGACRASERDSRSCHRRRHTNSLNRPAHPSSNILSSKGRL